MLEDLEEDTHLCIKCSRTIVGLENYVRHRKSGCNKRSDASTSALNREMIDTNNSYRSFEFAETSDKHEKQFNFNYEIESVDGNDHHHHHHHHHHDDLHDDAVTNADHIMPSPMHQVEKVVSDYKTDPNKSLSESYDYNYGLGADVFFSLLNLQSSSKLKTQNVATNASTETEAAANSFIKPNENEKMLQRKTIAAATLSHNENMDDWIDTAASSGTEKLMKAVSAISGTKKVCYDSPNSVYSYEYSHDHGSPDQPAYDDDDDDEIADDEDDTVAPPHTHTGGKWKPSERNDRSLRTSSVRWYERWDISDENNQLNLSSVTCSNEELNTTDEFNPPPCHTKGKWVPGTKIIKLDYKHKERPEAETSYSEQFWCRSCNRKLSSRTVYERHLKSKLHTKRSQPETELEQASFPLPRIEEIVTTRSKKQTDGNNLPDTRVDLKKKRKRRSNYIKCDVCKTRLRIFLYGKHLISHYHYRRMFKNPNDTFATILNNIHRIVLQSPYQCQPCRFYANTEETFMRHWDSDEHNQKTAVAGQFWCTFCKFVCNENAEMRLHLQNDDHQEVVMAINRSVPIIIRRRTPIRCEKCEKEFLYNIALRKHAVVCSGSKALGTASNQYQGKYYCNECNACFASIVAHQRHAINSHSTKLYFCGPCELSFSNSIDAKHHRVLAEHKVKAARVKAKKSLKRKCIVCGEYLEDLLLLKKHLREIHPDHNYSCYFCGEKFVLPQELSRHIRDKNCKIEKNPVQSVEEHHGQGLSTISLLELPIISSVSNEDEASELVESIKAEPSVSPNTKATNVKSISESTYIVIATQDTPKAECAKESLSVDKHNESSSSAVTTLWGCKQCDFRTPTEAECIFHEMLHKWNICKDNIKIPCPICNRMFGKNSLRCHLRLHTNERIFKCDDCQLTFTRKSNLKEHIQRIHMQKSVRKVSSQSSSHTSSSKAQRTETTFFNCSICQKRFKKKNLLEQHMHCHRQVVSIKVFQCTEKNCLFSGRSAAELRVHQMIHSNEKNYTCDVYGCEYKTKTKALLKRHFKSQHDTDSVHLLLCPQCEFSTKVSSHLKRHIRIHTGEKPYKCPHCDYVSNNPENLRKHVISTNKHPGRFLYECKLCSKSNVDIPPFATNNTKEYKSHLVYVHKQNK